LGRSQPRCRQRLLYSEETKWRLRIVDFSCANS
jgi:hypothetical protein